MTAVRPLGEEESEPDYGDPGHLQVSSIEQFKALVRDGVDSPAVEMTSSDFEQMRRELIDRHTPSRAG